MTKAIDTQLEVLRARLREVRDLRAAGALLYWDQATYMPPAGGIARARQMSTLGALTHQRQVDPELGRLIDTLTPYAESLPASHLDHALIRIARRDFERATRVPESFVAELTAHEASSFEAWKVAKPRGDFEMMRPYLERTVTLSRQLAGFFNGYEHIADPLIDHPDPGFTAATVSELFARLRQRLVPLVDAVCDRPAPTNGFLHRTYPESGQLAFGMRVAEGLGYDFARGRQDTTHHPFMIRFGHGDVRITTRLVEDDLTEALFGTIHEAGHALYEQGIAEELDGTPLGEGVSSAVHESQSRLWENLVGRSRGFWRCFYPELQRTFPDQLAEVELDEFHRAINRVERSLIRTEADELTYNLHVILRFELELELLEGRLAVADLPAAWNDRMEAFLGVTPDGHATGVLQDVHWYGGRVGGEFHGYAIGNVMSAQFYRAAVRAHPDIPDRVEAGDFSSLLAWLRDNVYRHGRAIDPLDLVEQATGAPLSIEPYIEYLSAKYGALYELD